MKKSDLIFTVAKVPVDYGMLLLASTAAYWIRVSGPVEALRPVAFESSLPFARFIAIAGVAAFVWVGIFALAGLYRVHTRTRLWSEFTGVLIGVSAAEMALIGFLFLRGEPFESRFLVLAVWLLALVFVSAGRFAVRAAQRQMVGRFGVGAHKVLLVGSDDIAQRIRREMEAHPDLGYRLAEHIEDLDLVRITKAVGNPGIHEVIVASPLYERSAMLELVGFCEEMRVGFRYVPSLLQASTMNVALDTFGGVPLVEVRRTPLEGWGRVGKRLFDIVGSIVLLVLSSPLLLVVSALIILDSRGSVFVRLRRISQGESFDMLKFRSMVAGAHEMKRDLLHLNERADGPLFKMRHDPRVTRIGRHLRRYRLDEFPQLWNVLWGTMSLVGPRPHEPEEVARYERHHKKQLLIKPGLTGLAQVSGASDISFEEEVKLDTYYIENWSLWMDFRVLVKTALVMLRPHATA